MVISRVRDLLAGKRTPPAPARPVPVAVPAKGTRVDPAAGEPLQATSGSLEDYFDRLDAALASKTLSPQADLPPSALADAPLARVPDAPAVAPPARTPVVPTVESIQPKVEHRALGGWDPPLPRDPGKPHAPGAEPEAILPPLPAAPPEPALPAPVATAAAIPEREPPPLPPTAPAPVEVWQAPQMHEAFAALLAAEQQRPISSAVPQAAAVSADVIEDIVRRVIDRLGDDTMRAAVLDTAERLVRDEIERIKNQRS
jgi:hypothetical protein